MRLTYTVRAWSLKRGDFQKTKTKAATVRAVRADDVMLQFTPRGGASWYPKSDVKHLRGGAGRKAKFKVTMADVRTANERFHKDRGDDFSFFDKKTVRPFGGDKFYGPYSGPGGTYFVVSNRFGLHIKKFQANGDIDSVREGTDFHSAESARAAAKKLAKG